MLMKLAKDVERSITAAGNKPRTDAQSQASIDVPSAAPMSSPSLAIVNPAAEVVKPPVAVAATEASKPSTVVSGTGTSEPAVATAAVEVIKPSVTVAVTGTSKPSVVVANTGRGEVPAAVAKNTGAALPSSPTTRPQSPRQIAVVVRPGVDIVEVTPTSVKVISREDTELATKEPVVTYMPRYPRWSAAPGIAPSMPLLHYRRVTTQDDIDRKIDMMARLFTLPRTAPGTQSALVDDAFGEQRQARKQLLPEKRRRSFDASDFGLVDGLSSISTLNSTKASATPDIADSASQPRRS
jgi:hypothetical protein